MKKSKLINLFLLIAVSLGTLAQSNMSLAGLYQPLLESKTK